MREFRVSYENDEGRREVCVVEASGAMSAAHVVEQRGHSVVAVEEVER